MSTMDKINALVASGELQPYVPRGNLPARRRLYLSQDAQRDLTDNQSATNLLTGRGFIEAALTRWTAGERLYGTKRRGQFLDRLGPPPPEIWEIRVTPPDIQARLFGRFAAPDTLILTKFHTRPYLGPGGSQSWVSAMASCKTTWDRLFDSEPHTGQTIHDYVTENCDDYPLR